MVTTAKKINRNSDFDNKRAQNPVIKPKFPEHKEYKESLNSLKILNSGLAIILFFAVVVTMFTYSIVVAKENKISEVHKIISEINYENIDLQSQVDYSKSFYNINKEIIKADNLIKPDKVVEVTTPKKVKLSAVDLNNKARVKPISGF